MGKKTALPNQSFISNLLFEGMIYRIISEPEDIWRSLNDMDTFINLASTSTLSHNLKKINSADKIVRHLNHKEGVIDAFTNFLEANPHALIILDKNFKLIYNNNKSTEILDAFFDDNTDKQLKHKLVKIIEKNRLNNPNNDAGFITLDRILDKNVYLQNSAIDTDYYTLLIPSSVNDFELSLNLITQYKLTKKETLLLSNIISGLTTQEISEKSSISLNTVRSHLKSIYRKTDTNTQSDLIRLFLNNEFQLINSYIHVKPFLKTKTDQEQDLFINLNSQSQLCYRDYGPRDGRPLVIFHNTLGSRYHIPSDYKKVLNQYNRRIIIPERPGYGRSDLFTDSNEDWNSIFLKFIDHLELSNFDLLGNVLGTSRTIEFIARHQERVNKAILTSPFFYNHKEQTKLLNETPYTLSKFANFSHKLAIHSYKLWAKSMKHKVPNMIEGYSGSAEQEAIKNEAFIDRIKLNFIESQRNKSVPSAEDVIFALSPRNLDLTAIQTEFEIWLGDEDTWISEKCAKEIYAPLRNTTFHICIGHGEDIFYHKFADIIQ